MQNIIEKTLQENIKNQDAVFVFPTEIAASMWADRATFVTDCSAVAMERFLAWDKFKGEAVRSENQNKNSVPSMMRFIFASNLIAENAENPFFKSLICPDYAKCSGGFTNWIVSILPKLALWKEYFDKSDVTKDEEDEDLLVLYEKYSSFLNKFNFFDPAWEKPPFKNNGKHYFVFFPEINSDWEEYKKILEFSKEFITLINVPSDKENGEGEVNFFKNARIEIKNVAGVVRKMHEENKIDWQAMAVSVPNMDLYGPYLDREFDLLEIPHVARFSRPLSKTSAGSFFTQIQECNNSKNSFDSIKNLLLNNELPWKDRQIIQKLILFGMENHCICSFFDSEKKEQKDVWLESFADVKFKDFEVENFYKKLDFHLKNFASARTFADVRKAYFAFRNNFFEMADCSEKADNILSRCIATLGELIDLEVNFNCAVPSPFNFFIEQLGKTKYLEQAKTGGVQIYQYKNAACAPFDCHFVVDSSQSSLSVLFKDFSFLNESKRRKLLNREETNVSDKFVQLYQLNSLKNPAYFTCAERTLDGYSQPVSYLKVNNLLHETDEEKLFPDNFYNAERNWFCGENSVEFPARITQAQSDSFNNWFDLQQKKDSEGQKACDVVSSLGAQRDKNGESELIFVSASLLKKFYDCPRKWLFDSNKLNLKEKDDVAVLIDQYASGNLYHKIMEIYCQKLLENKLPIEISVDEGDVKKLDEKYVEILKTAVDEAIISNGTGNEKNCYLKKELLKTTKKSIYDTIYQFVVYFSTIFNDCDVIKTEGKLRYIDSELNYIFSGRLDCLLQCKKSGQYFLVDFKNTKSAIPSGNLYFDEENYAQQKNEAGEEIPLEEQNLMDFQMPAYVFLLEQQENIKIKNAAFIPFKLDSTSKIVPVFGDSMARRSGVNKEIPDYDDFMVNVSKMQECVKNYVQKIQAGDFSLNSNVQNFEKCMGCDFNSICRKTFNVSKHE